MLFHLVGHVRVDIILTQTIISQGSQFSIIVIVLIINLFTVFYVKIASHFQANVETLLDFISCIVVP